MKNNLPKIMLLNVFLLLLFTNAALAQSDLDNWTPKLQGGLDQISLSRGALKTEQILDVFSDKQREIKMESIKSLFLGRMVSAGGTIYSFTDNIVEELITDNNPKVRTRKILESTVNLVFVTSYLNYYLATRDPMQNEKIVELFNAINQGVDTLKVDSEKPLSLASFREKIRKNDKPGKSYSDVNALYFISLLIDMSSEVVKNDARLDRIGFMKLPHSSTYEKYSKYSQLKAEPLDVKIHGKKVFNKNHIINTRNGRQKSSKSLVKGDIEEINILIDDLYNDMKVGLSNVTMNIGLVNYLRDEFAYKKNVKPIGNGQDNPIAIRNIKNSVEEMKLLKLEIVSLMESMMDSSSQASKYDEECNELFEFYLFVNKVQSVVHENEYKNTFLGDALFSFHSKFKPMLLKHKFNKVKYLPVFERIEKINKILSQQLISSENGFKYPKMTEGAADFLTLASRLYEFDKPTTIKEYLGLVQNIDVMFPDDNVKNTLSTILTFIKDYSIVTDESSGEEVFDFSVENFVAALRTIKPYKLNRWQFNMTVGPNHSYFTYKLRLEDSSIARNLNYIGEKIAVRYKIIDRAFWMTRDPGETYMMSSTSYTKEGPPIEPILSNVHVIGFGTGILYNIVNTTSNKDFDLSLAGVGIGASFYNSMDMNLTWGIPILGSSGYKKSVSVSFINIGMDIEFVEYYDRLKAKRKANRKRKSLVKKEGNS